MELNPDMKLAKEILMAQTLSPKDLATRPLNLQIDSPYIRSHSSQKSCKTFQALPHTFPLEEKLGKICGDALFDQGAWIYLFIPPSQIDELAEVKKFSSLESVNDFARATLSKGKSLLDKVTLDEKEKLKSLGIEDFSSNLNLLRQFQFEDKLQDESLRELSSVSLESFTPAFSQMTKRKLKENP